MGNSHEKNPDERSTQEKDLADRKSDATSDETLSKLEKTETGESPTVTSLDSVPSPDGALDESDEIKDAGPM